jgi:AcrR family transcriptional regulator
MPAGRPRERHAARRDEILRAAAAVFAAKGFHGASMRDIAQRLRLQQAAIYHYFSSKEALLEEICRIGIGEFRAALGAIAARDLPAREKIRLGVHAHLEPLLAQRYYVSAFLYLRRARPAARRRPLDRDARRYEALWRKIIREGQRRGEIVSDMPAALAAFAILGMCNTVARRPPASGARAAARLADGFTRLVCEGLCRTSRSQQQRSGR